VLQEAGTLDRPVLLICRSGQRSLEAAHALDQHGFGDVINVVHGFEGDLDPDFHRSTLNGWRYEGLPWEQL
jgi:rhodanese-related sulfurtransferase